jgi:hypothetical protein
MSEIIWILQETYWELYTWKILWLLASLKTMQMWLLTQLNCWGKRASRRALHMKECIFMKNLSSLPTALSSLSWFHQHHFLEFIIPNRARCTICSFLCRRYHGSTTSLICHIPVIELRLLTMIISDKICWKSHQIIF